MTYREVLEKRTGLKLAKATKNEVGKTYYCSYWQKSYKVLEIKEHSIWGEVYKCLWSDGTINTHGTKLDPKNDFEVMKEVK
jgi:hypothetical protein